MEARMPGVDAVSHCEDGRAGANQDPRYRTRIERGEEETPGQGPINRTRIEPDPGSGLAESLTPEATTAPLGQTLRGRS